MMLKNKRVLLTGASGGIGQAISRKLAEQGAQVGLVGRRLEPLQKLADELSLCGSKVEVIIADLLDIEEQKRAVQFMQERFGGIDILINNAGKMTFTCFEQQDSQDIELMFRTNVTIPMQLTQLVLPGMKSNGSGQIVNIGSIFGSIAYAYYVSYSASKYALRGFSEALRRELEGTGVGVTYIAPRAVNTPFNPASVYEMAEKVKMNIDDPGWVAKQIVLAIEKDKTDTYLGFPESFFVRINAILPRLVDKSVTKQNSIMSQYAAGSK
jgi:short-subunit dehydrogenase